MFPCIHWLLSYINKEFEKRNQWALSQDRKFCRPWTHMWVLKSILFATTYIHYMGGKRLQKTPDVREGGIHQTAGKQINCNPTDDAVDWEVTLPCWKKYLWHEPVLCHLYMQRIKIEIYIQCVQQNNCYHGMSICTVGQKSI